MAKAIDIKALILAAAQGAADGIKELEKKNIAVELAEFEIETTYDCTTQMQHPPSPRPGRPPGRQFPAMKFAIRPARVGLRRNIRYGLTVRFMFLPKSKTES